MLKKVCIYLTILVCLLILLCSYSSVRDEQVNVNLDRAINIEESTSHIYFIMPDSSIVEYEKKEKNSWIVKSLDESVVLIKERNSLLVFSNGHMKMICQGYRNGWLSQSGNRVVYSIEKPDNKFDLFIYDLELDESKLIIENVDDDLISNEYKEVAVSPDGNFVAYPKSNGLVYETYIYEYGKSSRKFKDRVKVIAISNDAQYIYYKSIIDDQVYVFRNNKATLIAENLKVPRIKYNNDLSQVIINNQGKTYLCIEGKNPEKIADVGMNLFLSRNQILEYGRPSITSSHFTDLRNAFFSDEKNIYTISDKSIKILPFSCWPFERSTDYKSVLYVDNDNLMYIENITKNSEPVVLLENIYSFEVSSDFKNIYYRTNDNALFSFDFEESKLMIDKIDSMTLNKKTNVIYYMLDDEIFRFRNNRKESVKIDEPVEFISSKNGLMYGCLYNEERKAYYVCTDDSDFKLIYKE